MIGVIFPYNESIPFSEVAPVPGARFRQQVRTAMGDGWRMLAFFAMPGEGGRPCLVAVLGQAQEIWALRSSPLYSFESMAQEFPQVQLFEREIHEQWGIIPLHHPWLKPVRVTPDLLNAAHDTAYPFYRVRGEEIHEVGVGPVHAGIIEPGHFRFQCFGEQVLNLEIALGYQHRGVEAMLMRVPLAGSSSHLRLRLVECIAGDASVGHALAQCVLLERLCPAIEVPLRQQYLRRIGLELERLACHCGDLGAMAGDTGYLPTSAWNGRIRGDFLNLTAAICGNRFGREYICPGGTNWDLDQEEAEALHRRLLTAGEEARGSCEVMFGSASVMDRFHDTGRLATEDALALGLVGVAGRACGIARDARFDMPLADLPLYATRIRTAESGDVYARALVRFEELCDSLELVGNDLCWLASHPMEKTDAISVEIPSDRLAIALVESWRGAICHLAITGSAGELLACKVIDPSFHNWPGLARGMRNGQISDFPLCNKSYNLSYCGHDL